MKTKTSSTRPIKYGQKIFFDDPYGAQLNGRVIASEDKRGNIAVKYQNGKRKYICFIRASDAILCPTNPPRADAQPAQKELL